MKKLINEFKEFAIKGNMFDMAIGVIIGSAFNNIINSFVNDLIMPIFSSIFSNFNLTDLKIVLKDNPENPITLNYGNFIQVVINFLIIALSIFLVVKLFNSFRKKKQEELIEEVKESEELKVLKDIKELLKNKAS